MRFSTPQTGPASNSEAVLNNRDQGGRGRRGGGGAVHGEVGQMLCVASATDSAPVVEATRVGAT
jgi:hypothetical protein